MRSIVPLLVCSQVKVEKSQVRKVVQECWKLVPASNSLSYTTYQYDYNRECRYSPVRRIGRYYTVSKAQLEVAPLWTSRLPPKEAASCPLSCPKAYELFQIRVTVFLW